MAVDAEDRMPNGTYPVSSQDAAQSAWDLREHSPDYSEAQVVEHIGAMVAKHGLTMPGEERQAAAMLGPHGMVWPDGLPDCSMCDRPANDSIHVNPPRPSLVSTSESRMTAADKSTPKYPVRNHSYTPNAPMITNRVMCQACGQALGSSIHVTGMPAGTAGRSSPFGSGPTLAREHAGEPRPSAETVAGIERIADATGLPPNVQPQYADLSDGSAYDQAQRALALMAIADEALDTAQPLLAAALGMPNPDSDDEPTPVTAQQAFVTEIGGRLIFATRGTTDIKVDSLPRQLAGTFERASKGSPHNLWVAGRYVEADRPNRNGAFWSTADLEVGAPSVTNGPLNWNHSEKEIIGAIVDSELVRPEREAAAAGVGNHIAALAVVWPYIHREKAALVKRASDAGRLWFSMECVSREVACLVPDCGKTMGYGDYMRQQASRCEHMRTGQPRRFIDPIFGGGAVIVPPINPGWAHANARVLQQAAALAERQAAAFTSLTTSEAELLVAALLQKNGD